MCVLEGLYDKMQKSAYAFKSALRNQQNQKGVWPRGGFVKNTISDWVFVQYPLA